MKVPEPPPRVLEIERILKAAAERGGCANLLRNKLDFRTMLRAASLVALTSMVAFESAAACWQAIPLDDLARMSDVIVVGRLRDVRQVDGPLLHPEARDRHYEGTIEIERTLWPEKATASSLTLRWSCAPKNSYRSTDLHPEQLEGERVLWLLDELARGKGGYHADHPGRTTRLDDDRAVRFARRDLVAPRRWASDANSIGAELRYPTARAVSTPPLEPWKSDVRLERLKNLFDETLAGLEAARPSDR